MTVAWTNINSGQISSIEFRQAQVNLLNAHLALNRAKYTAKIAELAVLQISGDLGGCIFLKGVVNSFRVNRIFTIL